MDKSADAFRTISEVAEVLGVEAHVLRFWETRFPQIRPVKRAGGRRYFRPTDVALLGGIRFLLRERGMTIRGVQKMLREEGISAVMELAEIDRVFAEPVAEAKAIRKPASPRPAEYPFAALRETAETLRARAGDRTGSEWAGILRACERLVALGQSMQREPT